MSIIENILDMIKREVRSRNVDLPDGKKGVLLFDQAGNERILAEKKLLVGNSFKLASVADMAEFAKSIPSRYGAERAAAYRELYVSVDDKDIPKTMVLADKMDSERTTIPAARFSLKEHRDFVHWFRKASNMTQTQFRNLLLQLPDQHDQGDDESTGMPGLAKRLEQLTFKVEINYQDSVEHARTREIVYKEQEMVGSVEIPKVIRVCCPVFSGAAYKCNVEMEVAIIKPKDEKEKIKFSLIPYDKTVDQILEEAAIWVASEEFVKPMQNIISGFAETIPALYVRADEIDRHTTDINEQHYKQIK